MQREKSYKVENKIEIFTNIVIVLNFQVQLELSHSTDYWRDPYSISLQRDENDRNHERQNKIELSFTMLVIVLNFQVQLELFHLVDS